MRPSLLLAAETAGRITKEEGEALFPEKKREALLACERMDHPLDCRDMGGMNPSKYLLYNDPFTGLLNHAVPEGADGFYGDLLPRLEECGRILSENNGPAENSPSEALPGSSVGL